MTRLVNSFAAVSLVLAIVAFCSCDHEPIQSTANRGAVSGRVLNEYTGDPVADVEVTCAGQETLTDDQGAYFLNDIPKGVHLLEGRKGGYLTYSIGLYISSETHHVFRLAQGNYYVSISGHVLLGDTDDPLEGIIVSCATGATISDADGFYILNNLRRDTYLLQASKNHRVKFTQVITIKNDTVVDIRMAASSLSGYVSNAVDGPVSGAVVRADKWSDTTDEHGFYRIDPIPQGTHKVRVFHSFYTTVSFEVVVLDHERDFNPVIQRTVRDTLYVLDDATVTASQFEGCDNCPNWGDTTSNFGTEPKLRLEHFLISDPGPPPKAHSAHSRFLLRLPDLPPTVEVEHLLEAWLILSPTGEDYHPGYITARRLLFESVPWSEDEITWATLPGARQLSYESGEAAADEAYQIDVMPIYTDTEDGLRGLLFQKEETGPAALAESIFFWSGEAPDTLVRPRVVVYFVR